MFGLERKTLNWSSVRISTPSSRAFFIFAGEGLSPHTSNVRPFVTDGFTTAPSVLWRAYLYLYLYFFRKFSCIYIPHLAATAAASCLAMLLSVPVKHTLTTGAPVAGLLMSLVVTSLGWQIAYNLENESNKINNLRIKKIIKIADLSSSSLFLGSPRKWATEEAMTPPTPCIPCRSSSVVPISDLKVGNRS
jgi:hypothetical protein